MSDRPIRRTTSERLRLSGARLPFSWSGRRLIAAAALLHVALAAGLFWAGRAQVAPRLLDRDAIIESFASDSYEYRRGAVRLAGILKDDGLRAWAAEPEHAHVKLISVQFALLGPLFGYGPLSAEPLNLFCYLSILSLVLLLGREVGGRRVGLLAAGVVALWPTFLLHTTQLLKDPLFIAGALALILIVTTWLTRTYNWVDAVRMGALAALAAGLLLLIRGKFGVVIFAVVFFGFALLVVRQLLERRLLYWNLVCPLLILVVGALTHFNLTAGGEKFKRYPSGGGGQHKSVAGPGRHVPGVVSYKRPLSPATKTPPTFAQRLYEWAEMDALRVGSARNRFNVTNPHSGSAIDRRVEFKNFQDPLLYLPRAFAIGFWAPFPDQWVGGGKRVGNAGRLLSGAETFIIYLCELLALLAVWRAPRSLPAWLLLLITVFGVTVLGLVVTNVGTLYRFRYLFWILLIILGAKGFESVVAASKDLKKRMPSGVAVACLLVAALCSCSSHAGSAGGDESRAPRASSAPQSTTGAGAEGSARTDAAPAVALDFKLVNFTGLTLRAVYVSPHDAEGWEENVLGHDEVEDGESVQIRFSPEERADVWDLRAEDTDGNSSEWKKLNLREISRIMLRLSEGVAIAEVE